MTIHPKDPETRKIQQAVDLLNSGGVLVCPTDTVYAFVCSAEQSRAIEEVARLKGVKPQKADLSLICRDLSELSNYARAVPTSAFRIMKAALPGPYTFVVPANSEIPRIFKNNKRTVGIRVPDHPVPIALVKALGHALVCASVHGMDVLLEHAPDPEAIHAQYGHAVEAVIDSGPGGLEGSTVIDLSGPEPVVLREGKGAIEELL
ncbi:MAG TPA: L-threonylcarbamoyladenylate synthase [Flavobacteriales bacterium]|nr:L-threonylcarbamoyladenylate synthase [Flavobacteriales bacterium]HNI04702.1 L-threonylcarbamoyladenylate synthase [Flavobacteriales bacterium]HNK85532.1 L-threonylcarbamoyladenylate synthase [Flavobacteriales bacterium]HNM69016.1 L-threonylcarbamoyladenylate synthase [Flavobacteriales bacterium]